MDEITQSNTPPASSTLAGAAVAAPVQTADVQTPAHGGSYIHDDAAGTLTLVEQTKQPGQE